MKKIRVIRNFWIGDEHFLPGRFLKDELSKEEIQQRMDDGFLVIKIVVEKKSLKKKKVKNVKNS
jgi:hypothetical protein